ncbi:outer membrane receptor for ferrienterochelin and colicin [Burkholderiales bacterium JOSHI_001]|nr:outer membrane receptor for ferrienterochelin and colicin [Burkholderiales bacterium JOSHI_001]
MFQRTRVCKALMAVLGGSAVLAAAPLAAQTADAGMQRVEVTGSNIKRIDLETSSPVQVISREEVRRSGAASVKELLDQLTSAGSTLSDINGSNSFASGASSANLRSLGKTSTLILLNSRRVSPYALADFNEVFTNLDALPLDAVDRVEILKNGASAIYGSDAVAGVVNIITRKDYQGLQMSASHEQSLVSDRYRQSTASITGGFGDLQRDRYNVIANLEIFNRDNVMWRDVLSDVNPLRFVPGAIPTTFATQASTFSYPGNTIPGGALPGCAPELVIGGLCRYDRFSRFEAVPEAKRINLLLSGRVLLGKDMEAFAELLFSRTKTKYLSPFQPYGVAIGPTTWGNPQTNAGQTFFPRGLPATHPLNSTGIDDVELRYRFVDAPAENTATSNSYRLQTGLRGTWNSFDWEAGLGFLGSKVDDAQRGQFSNSGFIALIGDYNLDPLPNDFFNKPGGYRIGEVNSAAVVDRLFPKFGNAAKTTQTALDFKITGDIGQMAGGPIGLAAGVDLRHEKFTITPSANLAAGDIVGFGLSRTDGSRNFSALFAELNLPVTKALEAQLAARLDKFPNLSPHISPKLGLRYRVDKSFMLRGTVEGGFRAANLAETAPSVKFAFSNSTEDPKRCLQALNLASDLRNQADPLPDADPTKAVLLARADTVEQNECAAGVAAIAGNNPKLKPEISRSFSLGFVFEPVQDLTLSVDYWNIRRRNEIDIKTEAELLNAEDAGLPPGASITRRALTATDQSFTPAEQAQYGVTAGPLDSITRSFENLFKTRTSGIDLGATFKQKLPFGVMDLSYQGTYLIKFKEFSGTINGFGDNLAGRYTYPRFTSTLTAALTSGSFLNGVKISHTPSTSLRGDFFDPTGTDQWCADRGLEGTCRVGSLTEVDYFFRYSGVKNLTLGVYVKNLFNQFPSLDMRGQFGTPIPDTADDAKRRSLKLTMEYKFF